MKAAPAHARSTDRLALLRAAIGDSLEGTVEHPQEVCLRRRSGALPAQLRGVLYRNGPGRFGVGPDRCAHLFDGDGLVARFALDERGVRYRSRFVRTRGFLEETRAGRLRMRSFGTNPPGGVLGASLRLQFKNTANTSVCLHGGTLLALWEAGLPHALDPRTLETLGPYDFGGALRPRTWMSRVRGAEAPFAAHPRRDPETGELWSFGFEVGLRPALHVYRVSPTGALSRARSIALPEMCFVHDFLLTRRACVFLLSSVRVDVVGMVGGWRTPLDAIESTERGVLPLVVPRDARRPLWFGPTLPRGFVYHLVNAFDADGEGLVIDALWMDGFAPAHFHLAPGSPLRRGEIPPAALRRVWLTPSTARVRVTLKGPVELPAVPPARMGRRARTAWMVMAAPGRPGCFTGLGKVDLESGETRRVDLWPHVASEPVFCPDPRGGAEEAGWLLVVCTHALERRSSLLVLDAASLEPLAEFALPQHLPPSFHGTWVPRGGGSGARVGPVDADQPSSGS
jgi:all-trans-8'-apo-beta-carotenal 15,15'-oxygenase